MTQPATLWISIKALSLEVATGVLLPTDVGRAALLRDQLTDYIAATVAPPAAPPPTVSEPAVSTAPPMGPPPPGLSPEPRPGGGRKPR